MVDDILTSYLRVNKSLLNHGFNFLQLGFILRGIDKAGAKLYCVALYLQNETPVIEARTSL